MANTLNYPERAGELLVQSAGIGDLPVSTGGVSRVAIAAGKTTTTTIKAAGGRLCRVLVTSAATAAMQFTDGDGTVLGILPASASTGQVYDFGMPAMTSITANGAAGNPAVTVSFI